MAVNSHRVGSGRNCSDPFTRLWNTRVAFHHVTQFLCSGDRGLWPRADDYVLARIRSKCRCAKRECEKDAHASDRPAAQATWSACCFHALIVMPVRIPCKPISHRFETKIRGFEPRVKSQSVQRKCTRRRLVSRAFASSLRLPPVAASFS